MPIADELPVVDPLEAVLVRLLAVGKRADPAIADQELERPEIGGFGLRDGERGKRRERRQGGQSDGESHAANMRPDRPKS